MRLAGSNNVIAGATCAVLAALAFVAGNALQKRALGGLSPIRPTKIGQATRSFISSPRWLIGASVSAAGLLLQTIAFGLISIELVQVIAISGMVLLVACGRAFFDERFGTAERLATGLTLASLAAVSISVANTSANVGRRSPYLLSIFVGVLTWLSVAVLLRKSRPRAAATGVSYGLGAGLLYGLASLGSKGLAVVLSSEHWTSAISKGIGSPYLYMFGLSWAMALLTFQAGLQRGKLAVVAPLSGSISAIYVVAVGTWLYGEHFPSNPADLVLRFAGFGGVVAASAILARGEPTADTSLVSDLDAQA